jgi:ribosomal protein L13
MEDIPNDLMYLGMYGIKPEKEPQSAYVAIKHHDEIWHLFNAERINLGRMAEMISIFIRGKHKPGYAYNRYDMGDRCVVVNASKLRVSGKKKH